MNRKIKETHLSDRDWDNLLVLCSGYLSMCGGDARRAMAKALAAHYDLISAAKQGVITAELTDGRVTLVVPESGGLALRTER